jgi:hypothetical protein
MKTSKFLVAAVLSGTLLVSSVFATEGNKPGNTVKSEAGDVLRKQIVLALSNVSAVDQEVTIRFAVTKKNGFEVVNVEGKDADLVDVVKSNLAEKNFEVTSDMFGFYSVKVRFSDTEVAPKEDASAVLRSQIADALSNVEVSGPASVKVAFSVENSNIKLKKVEGANKVLVSDVETALNSSTIVPPADLAGNYQIVVKF